MELSQVTAMIDSVQVNQDIPASVLNLALCTSINWRLDLED